VAARSRDARHRETPMTGPDGLDLSLLAAGPAAGLLLPPFLRALRGAASALLPNLIPAAFLVAVLGLTGQRGGLAAAVLLFLGLGIALDDLRVLLKTYRGVRENGREHEEAVRRALRRIVTPIVATAITASGGLLLFVAFGGTPAAEVGRLTLLLTGLALAADLLLLPVGLICCGDPDRLLLGEQDDP
jgi:predicted RND superfamily exporter protein